jgi:hypothetical protein
MSPDHPSDVLGALPRTRPHRRSAKRPARPTGGVTPAAKTSKATPAKARTSETTPAKARTQAARATNPRKTGQPSTPARRPRSAPLPQPAQPSGVPDAPRGPRPEPEGGVPVLRTAVGAAAELAEIGVSLSTRVLKRAVGRFPRP